MFNSFLIALWAVVSTLGFNMRNIRGIIGIVLITLCFEFLGCAKLSEDIIISKDSQGLIKIGMTVSQVAAIVGRGVQPEDYYQDNTTEYEKHTTWKVRSSLLSGSSLNYTFDFRNGKLTGWSKSGGEVFK